MAIAQIRNFMNSLKEGDTIYATVPSTHTAGTSGTSGVHRSSGTACSSGTSGVHRSSGTSGTSGA
jgi:hypothetical protein